jgi:hypothetical protein
MKTTIIRIARLQEFEPNGRTRAETMINSLNDSWNNRFCSKMAIKKTMSTHCTGDVIFSTADPPQRRQAPGCRKKQATGCRIPPTFLDLKCDRTVFRLIVAHTVIK